MLTRSELMSPGAAFSQQAYMERTLDQITEAATEEYLAEVRRVVRRDRVALGAATLALLWEKTVRERLDSTSLLSAEAKAFAAKDILASELPDTVYSNMRAVMTVAAEEGWSARKLDDVLAEAFRLDMPSELEFGSLVDDGDKRSLLVPGLVLAGVAWQAHVDRIARTTATGLYGDLAQAGFREHGIVGKKWISQRDGIVRDTHWTAEGTVVATESYFQVGSSLLMYPGDPNGAIEDVINCRCSVVGWNLLPEDVVQTPSGRLILRE